MNLKVFLMDPESVQINFSQELKEIQMLSSMLFVEILSLVVNSKTSHELWSSLEQQFGSETAAKKVHLKMMLNNLKKGSMTMTEYFSKLKSVTDELAIARSPVSSLDFITHLISRLGNFPSQNQTSRVAFMATSEGVADQGWYLNSGATHHFTNNVENLAKALAYPRWHSAMKEEFEALQRNQTWSLVPPETARKIVGNKWVYRVKYNVDGSISRLKFEAHWKCYSAVTFSFALKDLGDFHYFLGIEVTLSVQGIHLSQTKYIGDIFKRENILESKGCITPMSTSEKLRKDKGAAFENPSLYRSIVGSLQYVLLTRPDLAFTVNKLSHFLSAPTILHWQAYKRVLRYLQSTADYGLQFFNYGSLTLIAYSDADWGSVPDDRRSVGGYYVFLGSNLISWSSKKQPIVSKSSSESEYLALALATLKVLWITYLFQELKISFDQIPLLHFDNKSVEALASNPKYHAHTKHIELDIHFLREHIAQQLLSITYVPSSEQLADVLTKPLCFDQFAYLHSKLNVHSRP
ncbi:reverse transcriptase Ty1/copia-type domain-containing protein [Citrus sinensis]|nr:reverse transcriptase Ty1/copia-type domain-containing protein [Citrus sinensis]